MKSCEEFVSPQSDWYMYSPSVTAQKAFFYPICTGHFLYEPGYFLERSSYNSFLIIYIQKGVMQLNLDGTRTTGREGQFILLDCYKPHSYFSDDPCETLWLHFDGISARCYYNLICTQLGTVFTLADPFPALKRLTSIYRLFSSGARINEILLSKYITDFLTGLALQPSPAPGGTDYDRVIEKTVAYISSHLTDPLSVELLASNASLSLYHFIRIFKKSTGFTPHEYIIHTRIDTAKFMLRNTRLSIKEICFRSGFTNESTFSTCFKKNVGVSPNCYRTDSTI